MMDARTCEMLFKCDEMIAEITEHVTSRPGDICFSGSCSGSAGLHGSRWLRPGNTIRPEIERVGTLEVTTQDDQ